MDCSECQHKVKSSTMGIYRILKPFRKSGAIDDQAWMLVLTCLKDIEKQVASKVDKNEIL